MPNDVGTYLIPETDPPEKQFCWLSEALRTAGAVNESDVGFETFALLTGVFWTGLPSLMRVTVIGEAKLVPVTVIVAPAPPGSAGGSEPSWFRFDGDAAVAVGGFALYVNGTESGTAVPPFTGEHARPGKVRSMKPEVVVQERLPPRIDWSGGSVTMMEVFETFVTLSDATGTLPRR